MAQTVNQLTLTKVQNVKTPGMHSDGAGLHFRGKAKWALDRSERSGLPDARRKAADCHRLLDGHVDPIEHRTKTRDAAALASAKTITFKEAAAQF